MMHGFTMGRVLVLRDKQAIVNPYILFLMDEYSKRNILDNHAIISPKQADIFNKLWVREDQIPIRPLTEGKLE
jgi:hypothetical protein